MFLVLENVETMKKRSAHRRKAVTIYLNKGQHKAVCDVAKDWGGTISATARSLAMIGAVRWLQDYLKRPKPQAPRKGEKRLSAGFALFLIPALAGLLMVGCTAEERQGIFIKEIDGCEYLCYVNGGIVHKANCKNHPASQEERSDDNTQRTQRHGGGE